jgi:type I restriction enzyme M protein
VHAAAAEQDDCRSGLRDRRFLPAAYDFLVETYPGMDSEQRAFLKHDTFFGNEIVAGTRRLALMNMFLHNIGEIDGDSPISPNDALIAPPKETFDYVLANPPFGKKSSMSFTNEEGDQETDALTYNRQDFWATTSNKQLNFVQHIKSLLKSTGRAAVVVPDNVLFEAGAGETVRRKLLETTDLHTILRLPTGIFYANGVKANVLFFDNQPARAEPWTREVWVYDYRTNIHHTLKKKPLRYEDLQDFIACYNPLNRYERRRPGMKPGPEGAGASSASNRCSPATRPASIFLAQGQEPGRSRQPARAGRSGGRDYRQPGIRPGKFPGGCCRAGGVSALRA